MSDRQENQDGQEQNPGPEPERLNLEGDWEKLVGKALKKKRPKEGWPGSGETLAKDVPDPSDQE